MQEGSFDSGASLNERHRREIEYHSEFAKRNAAKLDQPVLLDLIESPVRRPWNPYWACYDILMAEKIRGKRLMLPGCGFGDDAIRCALLGAEVYASDLSPDLIEIAARRAAKMNATNMHLDVMAAESVTYPDNFFDIVWLNDMLHHVDVAAALNEARRVLKPEGRLLVHEPYTHSIIQKIRQSNLVSKRIYPKMVRFMYGHDNPYITEDEHKINEHELRQVEGVLKPGRKMVFLHFVGGRVLPKDWPRVAKFDSALLRFTGPLGRLVAGRFIVAGTIAKPPSH